MGQPYSPNCSNMNNLYRVSVKHFISVLLLLVAASAAAQPGGGGDPLPCDPDATYCPIDSWVFALAGVAVLSAAYYLHKNRKPLAV